MRNVKTTQGQRLFSREEWLTKAQIKGFFSHLAAAQRKKTTGEGSTEAYSADEEDLLQEELARLEEDREEEVHEVLPQIALKHPIQYEGHDICSLSKAGALTQFTVKELRAVCDYFELPRKSEDRKFTLISHVNSMWRNASVENKHVDNIYVVYSVNNFPQRFYCYIYCYIADYGS